MVKDASHSVAVSVVIPTHNRTDLLRETVLSILAQTYRDFELIVVSNGPGESTRRVLNRANDPRIRFAEQEDSGSPASPRNHGARLARGRYVAFCDDDDLWAPNALAVRVEVLDRHPEVALCYADITYFNDDGEEWHFAGEARQVSFLRLLRHNRIPASTVMVRRSVFEAVGGFDEAPEYRTVEDYDLWLRVACRYPVRFVSQQLMRYRVHVNNISFNACKRVRREMFVLRRLRGKIAVSPVTIGAFLIHRSLKYIAFATIGKAHSKVKRLLYRFGSRPRPRSSKPPADAAPGTWDA